jgi:hypothetical protein
LGEFPGFVLDAILLFLKRFLRQAVEILDFVLKCTIATNRNGFSPLVKGADVFVGGSLSDKSK